MLNFLYFCCIFQLSFAFNCKIPKGCSVDYFNLISEESNYEKIYEKIFSMRCDVKSGYPFEFDGTSPLLKENDSCIIDDPKGNGTCHGCVQLKWPKKELNILNSTFQISNLFHYLHFFKRYVVLDMVNLKGFNINLLESNSNKQIVT